MRPQLAWNVCVSSARSQTRTNMARCNPKIVSFDHKCRKPRRQLPHWDFYLWAAGADLLFVHPGAASLVGDMPRTWLLKAPQQRLSNISDNLLSSLRNNREKAGIPLFDYQQQ